MDLLGCGRLRLDINKELIQLAPRSDVWASTRTRIGRWKWASACAEPEGCLDGSVQVEERTSGLTLAFAFEVHQSVARGALYTFAIADASVAQEGFDLKTPLVELLIGPLAAGRVRKFTITPRTATGHALLTALVSRHPPSATLRLIDVDPFGSAATKPADLKGRVILMPPLEDACNGKLPRDDGEEGE